MRNPEPLDATEEFVPLESTPPTDADALQQELVPIPSEAIQQLLRGAGDVDYHAALSDRAEWESRLAVWDEQYYGKLPEKSFPWVGASNLNVPLTMLGVETLKPRLVESIFGEDPPILVIPVESTDADLRDRVDLFLNWQIRTQLAAAPLVTASSHLFLNPGTVVAKVFWRITRKTRKFIRIFPPETPPETIFDDLFGDKTPDWVQTGDTFEGVISTEGGAPLKVSLRLRVLEDGSQQVKVEQETLDERPQIDLIDPVDFIVPVKGGADVQKLPFCQHRQWLSEDALRRKVLSNRFYKDAVEELLHPQAPAGDDAQQDSIEVREGRDETEGVEGTGASNVRATQYEIIEDFRVWDIDQDGLEEEIIFWWSPQLPRKILGWDYRDNVYAHGKRPFVVGRYFPIPFRFYGLSFPEIIRNLQEEINTIHNQRVDFGTIQNMPWYFFRASATHAPTTHKLRPGIGIPLDNPDRDVKFPTFGGSPAFGQAEEALLYQYFERLTGLTDLALGRQPNRVGATRTATGVASLLSEAGLRFKTAMEAFQQFWVEIFEHVLALDQEYLPPGLEFRVTGRLPEKIKILDRSAIAGKFDLRLSSHTESLNKQVRREDATVVLNALLQPVPLQAGLVTLRGIHRALRDFLSAYGRSNPEAYIESPVPAMIRLPEEELAMWSSGGDVEPSPAENLPYHVQVHSLQLRDPQIARQPALAAKIVKHLARTIELIQTQQMAANMGPRSAAVGPQAMNAQIGQTAPQTAPVTTTASTMAERYLPIQMEQ